MRIGLFVILGLVASLLSLLLFVILADAVARNTGLLQFDREVSGRLEEHGRTSPGTITLAQVLTSIGGADVQVALAILVATSLVVAAFYVPGRKRLLLSLALIWMITLAGGALLNQGIKQIFQRHRPQFTQPLVHEASYSFPSGHSMSAMIDFGMLAYLLLLLARRRWQRVAIVGGFGLLIVGIGVSRIYLGAHWPTDVVGGFSAGVVWLTVCIAAGEWLRRRQANTSP